MRANPRYKDQPKSFWADVRLISQEIGYTDRKTKQIRVPTAAEIKERLEAKGIDVKYIMEDDGSLTEYGEELLGYFRHRAQVLNEQVEPNLMDKKEAEIEFNKLRKELSPTCPIPMNKQKGDKKRPAYLTGIVNMLIESNAEGCPCDYNPRGLTTITKDGRPLRTLARWLDGAFPRTVNPIAIWEIKEYYNTTTFGSRVADGVYESLLDGMEIEELKESEGVEVSHYLIIDDHYTWWDCGRSYLCRIIDMLHMGYVDEVLFGREVLERLPKIVKELVEMVKASGEKGKRSTDISNHT